MNTKKDIFNMMKNNKFSSKITKLTALEKFVKNVLHYYIKQLILRGFHLSFFTGGVFMKLP